MLPAMHTGKITRGLRPDWEPLTTLVGREVVRCFMWMFALEFDDGQVVHGYKSIATRRYLHLATDGRAFAYQQDSRYREVSAREALEEVFTDWEDAYPRPRDPEAVHALLERHRSETANS
jgi:hypothetical protein